MYSPSPSLHLPIPPIPFLCLHLLLPAHPPLSRPWPPTFIAWWDVHPPHLAASHRRTREVDPEGIPRQAGCRDGAAGLPEHSAIPVGCGIDDEGLPQAHWGGGGGGVVKDLDGVRSAGFLCWVICLALCVWDVMLLVLLLLISCFKYLYVCWFR